MSKHQAQHIHGIMGAAVSESNLFVIDYSEAKPPHPPPHTPSFIEGPLFWHKTGLIGPPFACQVQAVVMTRQPYVNIVYIVYILVFSAWPP